MLVRHLPRFREAARRLPELAARERWSRTELTDYQLGRLNALWRRATAEVPHYRALTAEQRLPRSFDSLEHFRDCVPVLSKQLVRDDPRRFLSERPEPGGWHRTGGSTGTPMGVYWSKQAHLEMLRCKYRHDDMWGLDIFDRKAFLWGHSHSFSPGLSGWLARLRRPLEDRLRNRLRLSAYHMGRDDLRDHLRRLRRFRPASLYSYSSAAYLLARAAAETGFTCDSLRLITLSAEPAFLDLVDEIERAFGVPAVVEYGSVECGFIAHECPDRVLRVREDMCLVETLPRDDGRYEIVVTVLNNPSFPLIRYAIEDVTDAPLHVPPAGFAVLQNVVGRSNDFLQGRTGKQVHPQGVKHVLEHCGSISRFRAHQDASGALALQVQFHGPISTAELGRMEQKLSELLDGYAASIEIVETMPTTLAGKHRWIISDLAPPMRIPSSKPRADRERELVTV